MPDLRDAAANAAWWAEYSHRRFSEKLARTEMLIRRSRVSLIRAQVRQAPGRAISVIGVLALGLLAMGRSKPR